jgi:NADH-quinone oxidoreductase subunit E
MARLDEDNVRLAHEIIGRYPKARSATIPLLHLAQQQDGYVTTEAIAHVAELVGATAAEVQGTATFYEMFKFQPVGTYLVNICGTMSCQLMGSDELMHHAEHTLGVKVGGTTADSLFTLEHAECQAACTEAPNVQVNYRHCHRMTPESFDQLIADLRAGKLNDEIPAHGTLARVRQQIPVDRAVGAVAPDASGAAPAWLPTAEATA